MTEVKDPLPFSLTECLGETELLVDVDAETYDRLQEQYRALVELGYSEDFDTFAINNTHTEIVVTVNGEPVDPRADRLGDRLEDS